MLDAVKPIADDQGRMDVCEMKRPFNGREVMDYVHPLSERRPLGYGEFGM